MVFSLESLVILKTYFLQVFETEITGHLIFQLKWEIGFKSFFGSYIDIYQYPEQPFCNCQKNFTNNNKLGSA